MGSFKGTYPRIAAGLLFVLLHAAVQAGDTDPDATWPLCGRITEAPPVGWSVGDDCPADRFGAAAYSDEPLSSTFGPRPLFSEANRYDFHRGVDIATPIGTPFFAITDGTVEIAGNHPSYSDPLVKLRHFRPGDTDCSPDGCYHSYYLHISSWVVAENDSVVKGQLLGYTGESASGFDHLHFEVRDAPPTDIFSAWQRDAIHPLSVLPYAAANNTTITFNLVDFTNPSAGRADLTVDSNRFDLVYVGLELFDAGGFPIAQPGNTPDANGYLVEPSTWDMEQWNFQYTHKDSTSFPWSSYGAGGANECPYHAEHGPGYEAGLHMDAQQPGEPLEGLFNGLHIRTQKYWPSDVDDYTVDLDFQALTGPAACIEAIALFASGDIGYAEWGTCGASSGAAVTRGPYLQMQTDDGVIVRWRTDAATDSVVRYGNAPGNLTNSVTVGGSRTEHEVQLTGLGAATTWYYSVGDSVGHLAGNDASHFFSTAPTQGLADDTRIWVLGDSGTANANARAVRDAYKAWAAADPADLVLMLGDNAYNDGTDAEYQAAVFDTYPEVLRQTPLFSTLGNHDGHTADSATQSGPYYDIFNLPAAAEIGGLLSGTEAYYSFDYANIHFVCLDSYDTDRSPGGAMMTWLQNDLALNTQPWVIAFWHHPPYTKGSHNSDTEGRLIDMRQNALPLLEDWGVDLVMSGHSHSYERSYLIDGHYGSSTTLDPVANVLDPGDGNETSDGAYEKPDTLAAAHAGAVYAVAGSSGKISGGSLDHPAMFVSVSVLGSMILDVSGNRMDVTFLTDTGAVQDQFTMQKGPDTDPPLITGATAEDATHVVVDFNEALDLLEAEIDTNYTIPGLTVNTAELLSGERSVRLTTSAMADGASYTLTVNNVQDLALNTIAPNSTVNFDFFQTMTAAFQDGVAPDAAYAGTDDAYIREASPDTGYGNATDLQVDGSEPSGSSTDMNIVLAWDTSSLPTDATVMDASMQLEVTNISTGSYDCFEVLEAWDEGSVTWNNAASSNAWAGPGASGAARGSDVVCQVNAGSTGPLTVNFNAAGLAMIEGWLGDPASNHGIVITHPSTGDGADFHASESASTIARPKLEITYWVPTPPPNQDPVADFTYGCTDLDCGFTDASSDPDGTVVGWSWDFGDTNGSSAQNPNHSYAATGDYTVTLTVTDDQGATDMTSQLVSVTAPPNQDPVAGFTYGCTDLDCGFTDASSDPDGTVVGWSWDFGDTNGSSAQNPNHSYAATGDYTVTLTVTDDQGATDMTSQLVSVTAPPTGPVDHLAEADLPSAGTVTGTYIATHGDEGAAQRILERESGGKKSNRYSHLSHTWRFQAGATGDLTVIANAWSSGSSDGDDFLFEWSSDNDNFTPLFTVSSTSVANVQSTVITAGGTVYIRVTDTDQTRGNRARDTVYVDHLVLRSEDAEPPTDPPPAPTGLQVTGSSSSTLTLAWLHPDTTEDGFDVQRRLSPNGTWGDLPDAGAGSTGLTDTGLADGTAYDYRIRAWNAAGVSAWSNVATGATDAAPPILLSADGYKVRGRQQADLSWAGAGSAQVDIVRDDVVIATVANSGAYTDAIGNKGGGSYTYRVCEAGSSTCSNDAVVSF